MSNKIFHYRLNGNHDECADQDPWSQCVINHDTNLDDFRINHLVTIGGQPVISQHSATYITGRDTCHAHHFAKMLAGAVLSGAYTGAPSLTATRTVPVSFEYGPTPEDPHAAPRTCTRTATPGTVLWIDTIHSPHDCARLFSEMHDTFRFDKGAFNLYCLDMLGVFREDFYCVLQRLEQHISKLKPALIVIDDIDHFMPNCGINVASTFSHIFRDTLNHTESAFLLIGYNHLSKRASTTGNLGKLLFPQANSVFSVSTVNGVSHVRPVRAFECRIDFDKAEFIFTIGADNMPRECVKHGAKPASGIDDETLRDIIDGIIQEDSQGSQSSQGSEFPLILTPSTLLSKVKARHAQFKRDSRDAALLDQIHRLHIFPKGNPEGRDSGTSHAPTKQQGGSGTASTLAVGYAADQQRPPQDQGN